MRENLFGCESLGWRFMVEDFGVRLCYTESKLGQSIAQDDVSIAAHLLLSSHKRYVTIAVAFMRLSLQAFVSRDLPLAHRFTNARSTSQSAVLGANTPETVVFDVFRFGNTGCRCSKQALSSIECFARPSAKSQAEPHVHTDNTCNLVS